MHCGNQGPDTSIRGGGSNESSHRLSKRFSTHGRGDQCLENLSCACKVFKAGTLIRYRIDPGSGNGPGVLLSVSAHETCAQARAGMN